MRDIWRYRKVILVSNSVTIQGNYRFNFSNLDTGLYYKHVRIDWLSLVVTLICFETINDRLNTYFVIDVEIFLSLLRINLRQEHVVLIGW